MITQDVRSQLDNQDAIARFRNSAPERELVKRQLREGYTPAEIENRDRVERRVEHLGANHAEAARVTEAIKGGPVSSMTLDPSRRRPGLERIIGEDDLLSTSFLERGALVARSVCCVRIDAKRIGTGFLVGPRLMLTNAHVLRDRQEAARSSAEFEYEDSIDGNGVGASVVFKLAPEDLFLTSPEEELDYALVAIKPKSGKRNLEEFDPIRLNPVIGKVLRGEALNIIQHPSGAPKRVALRQNRFTALLERYMHYETDTMPGSSGAPVFNDQWDVVCLHHSGVPLLDSEGRVLTKDGRIWDQDRDDPALIQWVGNEGVRISRIVADVGRQVGETRTDLLDGFPEPADFPANREEALTSILPTSGGRSDPAYLMNTTETRTEKQVPRQAPTPASTSVSIPLTLTFSLTPEGQATSIRIDTGVVAVSPPPYGEDVSGTVEERGLRNLERSRTRVYFDQGKDQIDRDRYYRGVNPNSSTLFETLKSLVSTTHATQFSYRVARVQHLYAWVDLQPEKNVRSIYSDERFDPGHFIREDFDLERRLDRVIERRRTRESNLSGEALERLIASLEANEPFNCEHVVPQSWFDDRSPMQGDLHHLFTCQSQCNSFRGNLPYRDFGKFTIAQEAIRPRCGFTERGLFEPFMGKGKVARATLYFLIRYPGRFDNRYEDLERGLETLLDWHSRTPVTDHERHRNQAIFELQGNRNPFIDHPEWAARTFPV